MFKNPFSFNGRIRRLEYGLTIVFYIAIVFILSFVFAALTGDAESDIIYIFLLPVFWILIAQAAKRCHDLGNSGWWQLIPFYGFWLLFADGQHGNNEYGPNPKGIGNTDEIDQIGNYLTPGHTTDN
jgi:uncharacterized membrane protein YhaH (DUF805 family)